MSTTERTKPVVVLFNGKKFRRLPSSKHRSLRVYYSRHESSHSPPIWLHQEVWKHHNGPIPKGHEIHHSDGDPFNNDITNLECLTVAEHRRRDAERGGYDTESVRKNLDRIRPLAAKWHASEQGRQWHRENGKAAWKRRKPVTKKCEQCGKDYQSITIRSNDRTCSRACYAALRRDSGADNEPRDCSICKQSFSVNRFAKTRTCSPACAIEARRISRAKR